MTAAVGSHHPTDLGDLSLDKRSDICTHSEGVGQGLVRLSMVPWEFNPGTVQWVEQE